MQDSAHMLNSRETNKSILPPEKRGLPLHVLSRMLLFFCYVTNAYITLTCRTVPLKFIFLPLKSREICCNCVYKECLFENSMSLFTYITRQNRPQHNVISAFVLLFFLFFFFCRHYLHSKPEPAFVNTRVWVTTPLLFLGIARFIEYTSAPRGL